MPQNVDDIGTKSILIGGDLNLHFNQKLEAKGGKPTLKKKSIGKMIELIENFELCDIWRIRNPNTVKTCFSFVSNKLQESIKNLIYLRLFQLITFLYLLLKKIRNFTR